MPRTLIALYLTTILATGLTGLFVLLQNKKSVINRAFFGFTSFQVFWILSLYFGYQFALSRPPDLVRSEIFVELAYGVGLLMMLFLVSFLYLFPQKSFQFGRIKIWLYTGIMVVMSVLAAFSDLVHEEQLIRGGVYLADSYGPLYGIYSIMLLLSLLLAAFIATKKLINLKGLERRKMAFTTTGIWLFCITTITTNIVLPLYGLAIWGTLNLAQISPSYTLLFTLPTFYSIYKHRFFNFSYFSFRVFRSLILYSLFLISTFALYILILNLAPSLNFFFILGTSALVALMITNAIQVYVPEFVTENLRDFRNSIGELKSAILSSENLDQLQGAFDKTFSIKLNFANAKLYLLRDKQTNIDLPVYQRNSFTKALMNYKKDALIKDEIEYAKLSRDEKKKLLNALKKLDADMCVPLFSEGNLIGFFVLRRTDADTGYSREKVDAILDAKRGLEVALMNVLLKMNLEEENNLMKAIIERKTRQLKKKIKEINELLKQQADFIAVTAHEFRTPLSIATFQVDDIMHSRKPASQRIKELSVVQTSIANIKMLIDKLFAVQQYDLNKVELHTEKINIVPFVESIYKDFVPIMKDKGLKFSLSKGSRKQAFTMMDQAQLRQVLHNLLTNASKFTPKGEEIKIRFRVEKGNIDLRIDDSGDGIPDDLKKSIFEKFRTKKAGAGIGLGLYLCKKIVELHKGKIWVEDSQLGGASFRIQLKLSR